MGRGSSKAGEGGGGMAVRHAEELTEDQERELRERYESGFSEDTKKSIEKYISRDDFDGSQHSLSQIMNYIINEGIDLENATTSEIESKLGISLTRSQLSALKKTSANLDAAMHPIGRDVILQRGCHQGDLRRLFGIDDYTTLSESELRSRLVGGTFKNPAVMSTSYNVSSNPFLGGGSDSGGREVVYNIKAAAGTPMVWGAAHQTEAILGKGINWRITDVKYTGKTAMPKKTLKTMPQIQIDIETY